MKKKLETLKKLSFDHSLVLLLILSVIFIGVFSIYWLLLSLDTGLNFKGYAADGPFQLYNPLRRLADGQIISKDFLFFHGSGIPLLFYPLYKLMGSNIFASEFSRWFISFTVLAVVSFLFFFAVFKSYSRALISLALSIIAIIYCSNMIDPGNSLLGVRSSAPILIAAAIIYFGDHLFIWRKLPSWQDLLVLILITVAFFLGTEHGIAAIGAYVIAGVFASWKNKKILLIVLRNIAIILLFLVIAANVISLGNGGHLLKYALIDVPVEQFWYFGTPPTNYLSFGDFTGRIPLQIEYVILYDLLFILSLLLFAAWRIKIFKRKYYLGLMFLISYGFLSCVSMLGYFHITQAYPLLRVLILASVAILIYIIFPTGPAGRLIKKIKLGASFILAALLVFHIVIYVNRASEFQIGSTIKNARAARGTNDYGVAAPDGWKVSLGSFPELDDKNVKVWSTYSSLYESNFQKIHPSDGGFDYIIHALGTNNKNRYEKQFLESKPDYVLTLKQTYFPFEEWLWSKNSTFYVELFENYHLTKQNASHFLWQRNEKPKTKTAPLNITIGDNQKIRLPVSKENLIIYLITVDYEVGNNLKLLENNRLPRYLLSPEDTGLIQEISLPPYAKRWSFIVPVYKENKNPRLEVFVDGIVPGAKMNIKGAHYEPININDPDNFKLFYDNSCYQRMAAKIEREEVKTCSLIQ